MAKTSAGGCMNKHNAYQNTHNKQKYERQSVRSAVNKRRHIEAQSRFQAKKRAEHEVRA